MQNAAHRWVVDLAQSLLDFTMKPAVVLARIALALNKVSHVRAP